MLQIFAHPPVLVQSNVYIPPMDPFLRDYGTELFSWVVGENHSCRQRFLVAFVHVVDSSVEVAQSMMSMRQSASKFLLFSGLDGALVVTKSKYFAHA